MCVARETISVMTETFGLDILANEELGGVRSTHHVEALVSEFPGLVS